MQKVVDFLEKNVQWLVLGVAGVVFLLMVWIYVLKAPVTVHAGSNKEVMPGDIDKETVNGPVAKFKQLTANPTSDVEQIQWPTVDYQNGFIARATAPPV